MTEQTPPVSHPQRQPGEATGDVPPAASGSTENSEPGETGAAYDLTPEGTSGGDPKTPSGT